MSKIIVSLPSGGGIEWKGGRHDGLFIINKVKALVESYESYGMTFTAYTHGCLYDAFRGKRNEGIVAAIVALVLQYDTGDKKHPGRFIDYLDSTDFIFDIVENGEGFGFKAKGFTWERAN
jgi:hypothetical protein